MTSAAAPTDQPADRREVVEAIREVVGDSPLRPGQHEAIEAALNGDALAVLATGTGKSLVYRVAGAVRGGLSVVISPTLSLQMDQLAALHQSGPPATMINSTQRAGARRAALAAIADGSVGFVLLAPEQTANEEVMDALRAASVRQFVVDEAHCVVAWGHDFRPDYLHLGPVIAQLGRPPILALTATASPRTRARIVDALGLRDPAIVVGEVDRPEIWLGARVTADEEAVDDVIAETLRDGEPDARAIVYAPTRARAERLAERLAAEGRAASVYHGGLSRAEREAVHRDFHSGAASLVVGTNAFGLGVDRPDVRLVLHADAPADLDSYYQEAGRAGRDGDPARAVLVTHPGGFGVRKYFASTSGPSAQLLGDVLRVAMDGPVRIGALARAVGASQARTRAAVNALAAVGALRESSSGIRAVGGPDAIAGAVQAARTAHEQRRAEEVSAVELVRRYAETRGCRRRLILELLGEPAPQPCGNCDNCDAGLGEEVTDVPFPLGSTVRHAEWGEGLVEQYEEDRVTVLFPAVGHKTLLLELVAEHSLLEPAR